MGWLSKKAKNIWEKIGNIVIATTLIIGNIVGMNFVLSELGLVDRFYFSSFHLVPLPLFIMACVLAPLWEELVFRYAPLKIAGSINPILIVPVIIISSAIFGWGHHNGVVSLLYQGIGGVILSVLYLKNNNSYWSCVIVHALWNIIFSFFS